MELIGIKQIFLMFTFLFILILPTIIALIDILKNKFTENNKIIWVLVVLLGNFLGAILYFMIGRKQKIQAAN